MSEHGVSHLVVLEASGGDPVGILSTLDLTAVYAREPARVTFTSGARAREGER